MTEEQIKELEGRIRLQLELVDAEPVPVELRGTGTGQSIYRGFGRQMPLTILRLLEERKRLLDAFAKLKEHGLFERGDRSSELSGEWDSIPWAQAKQEAEAALAYAEEEA